MHPALTYARCGVRKTARYDRRRRKTARREVGGISIERIFLRAARQLRYFARNNVVRYRTESAIEFWITRDRFQLE